MNADTRSALLRASTDIENAATILDMEDPDLTPGEALAIRSWTARLNDISAMMGRLVDRADRRKR